MFGVAIDLFNGLWAGEAQAAVLNKLLRLARKLLPDCKETAIGMRGAARWPSRRIAAKT